MPQSKPESSARPASLAILTQQISNYHLARFRMAAAALEHVTIIAATNDYAFPEFLSKDRGDLKTVTLFDGIQSYFKAISGGGVWAATRDALDAVAPSVVAVAGWASPESLSAIAWAHDNRAGVIMMSESQQHDSARQALREQVKAQVVKLCDASLVGGQSHEDYITALGMPRDRVFHGYDVVDNAYFSNRADADRLRARELRQALQLPQHYLLASARFIPKKNLTVLVRAFGAALKASNTPHSLVILGDGPGRPALEQAIAQAELTGRVLLPGFKGYDCLPSYYALADAFVHSSLTEQWGLVINEAAAAGLPLIVSRTCGAASALVQPPANGWLVDANVSDDIAAALTMAMITPPEQRAAMGHESRRIVQSWGPDRFARGMTDAFDVAKKHQRARLKSWDRLLLQTLARRYHSAVS